MGYTTDFDGEFVLNKPLDAKTLEYLQKFNASRRMARNLPACFGIEGEFYVDGQDMGGLDRSDNTVIDHNRPPKTQPGLWCGWVPNDTGTCIEWDGAEKFYNYIQWIEYLINSILAPRGYKLTGVVRWRGEDFSDIGTIIATNNKIKIIDGKHEYKAKNS